MKREDWPKIGTQLYGPYRYEIVSYYKPQEIGSKMFYSAKEAAQRAKQLTDHDDKVWGAVSPPMRRPWAYLLEDAK